jgi:hypothetical protein
MTAASPQNARVSGSGLSLGRSRSSLTSRRRTVSTRLDDLHIASAGNQQRPLMPTSGHDVLLGVGHRTLRRNQALATEVGCSVDLQGLEGSGRELLSAAILFTAVAISEESLSRGLVQRALAVLGPVRAAVGVALLFGAGHTFSGLWFSHPMGDTIFISMNAAAFGFACAALRWHLRTIWPLVFVHALGDMRLPADATGVTSEISPAR